jgi:hypothetical protein
MTQQPYYPPQPQQGYAPQFPQAPVQYAPPPQQPVYAPPVQQYAPQAPAQPPLANGSLDDYYSQPTGGGGPGISWKDKPLGTTYAGVVKRDVTNGDVVQDSDFTTKQPKFYRDGRPVFVMKVPLQGQPSQEFPDGEFAFWVRGQARDELARAMAEAGVEGAPKAGALIQVALVERKPSRQGNPANIVRISYTPAGGAAPAQPQQAAPIQQPQAPAPQQVQYQQPQAPVQQYAPPVAQQEQPPAWAQPAPVQQPQLTQQVAQPVQQAAPAQAPVQQSAPPAPAGLTPEQEQLLAQLNAAKQAS